MRFNRIPCGGRRRPGGILEHAHGLVASIGDGLLGLREIGAEALLETRCRFATQREPLAYPLQTIQRSEGRLTTTGRVRQLILCLPPLLERRNRRER